jgi:ABC-type sugar transport system ATPase subunit
VLQLSALSHLLQAFLTLSDQFVVLRAGSYMNLRHPEKLQEALEIAAKSGVEALEAATKSDIEALRKELEALSMATKSYIEALVSPC